MDPHGAVGYLGLQAFLKKNGQYNGVFLETAHPVKFLETVEAVLNKKIQLPEDIRELSLKEKKSIEIRDYDELKAFLLN